MGGPMMGSRCRTARVPVVKGTSGILALTPPRSPMPEPALHPLRQLRAACPMGLLPLEMAARIRAGDLDGAVDLGLKDCIACGCCAYVCPSHIPLVQYFNHAKGELAAQERAKLRTDATKRLVAAARSERLEREAREKAEAAAGARPSAPPPRPPPKPPAAAAERPPARRRTGESA